MAFNPVRSWATTYSQMWNLCMKDPLVNNKNNHQFRGGAAGSYFNNNNSGSAGKGNGSGSGVNKGGPKGRKPRYCWNFNKGIPCKFGPKCRFIERCSYCDSPAHRLVTCPKAPEKDKQVAVAAVHNDTK